METQAASDAHAAGFAVAVGERSRASIAAVLFDVDGVIADTARLHTEAWARLAALERLPFDRETAEALRGLSREDSLRRVLGARRVTQQSFHDMLDRKNAFYLELLEAAGPADCLPGAVGLLGEFAELGMRRAAVSLSRNAGRVLERLGIFERFDVIVDGTAQTGGSGLDRYHRAAALLGVAPRRCLVFEDSAAGIATAKNAGMRTIGLGDPRRLAAADMVFESLRGVSARCVLRWLGGSAATGEEPPAPGGCRIVAGHV
ncbi:MAG: hypothetical protein DCC65_08610 [Planctomycetota bacterium]|nr:MAG: hypothetical protein DCC65_08610 [Planctomycetota bacterium]